jgi:hypothetical protein
MANVHFYEQLNTRRGECLEAGGWEHHFVFWRIKKEVEEWLEQQ